MHTDLKCLLLRKISDDWKSLLSEIRQVIKWKWPSKSNLKPSKKVGDGQKTENFRQKIFARPPFKPQNEVIYLSFMSCIFCNVT